MLVHGDGIPKQVPAGLMWLNLSSEEEYTSRFLLHRLSAELTPEQLAEGERLAAQWRESRK